jgi:hypothetical protein
MGYNFSSVSYLSLATKSLGKRRSKTIAVMVYDDNQHHPDCHRLGQLVEPIPRMPWLERSTIGLVALFWVWREMNLGRFTSHPASEGTPGALLRASWKPAGASSFGTGHPVGRILGQDILLEPFGEAFGMSVHGTTRITSIWEELPPCLLLRGSGSSGRTDSGALGAKPIGFR